MRARMKLAVAALLLGLGAACGGTVQVEKDIAFLGPDRAEKLDAYLPASSFRRPVPAVIWIHGGGWKGGDKGAKREVNVCRVLAENGYAAFSINYALGRAPNQGERPAAGQDHAEVPWPANFHDCKSALRFLRKEAARFGIDSRRIAVAGGSAGGHLAMLVGMTGSVPEMNAGGLYPEQDNRVSCIIDLYGAGDVSTPKRAKHFAGATPEETAANVKAASPLSWLRPDTPPILILHGDKDGVVPVRYSRDLAKALAERSLVHEYVEIPGAPHSFDFQPAEMDLRPVVLQFLEKYLGRTDETTAGKERY